MKNQGDRIERWRYRFCFALANFHICGGRFVCLEFLSSKFQELQEDLVLDGSSLDFLQSKCQSIENLPCITLPPPIACI